MEYMARAITDIVLQAKEVLATWATEGFQLTPQGQALVDQLALTLGQLSNLIVQVIADLLSMPSLGPML